MSGQDITFEVLTKMANHFKKKGIHDYDKFKSVEDWQGLLGEDRQKAAQNVITLGYVKPKHGDGFQWLRHSYRNSDLLFWHDEKGVLFPYIEIDDYGSVPPDFRVGNDFLPDHWQGVVDHNSVIFLSDELTEQIKAVITQKRRTMLLEIKGYPYKVIVLDGCTFKGLPWATHNRNIIYFQHWS